MDIGIAAHLNASELRDQLVRIFPTSSISVVNTCEEIIGTCADILAIRCTSKSEFPTGISLHAKLVPEYEFEPWLREVARRLSEQLGVRTIVDGSPFGDGPGPFWSLVWDIDLAWLADDCNSLYFGDGIDPVRIIRLLPMELFLERVLLDGSVSSSSQLG